MSRLSKAICIGLAVTLLASLAIARSYSHSTRSKAWLGTLTTTVDKDNAITQKTGGKAIESGALVEGLSPKSPATKAGLQEDDVIIEANGAKIESSDDLEDAVDALNPGDKLTLTVLRDGKEMQLIATLDDERDSARTIIIKNGRTNRGSIIHVPNAPKASKAYVYSHSFGGSTSYIGVQLTELNRQLGEYFGVTKGQGVLVNEVEKDSPAEKAGIKAGDVILAVDNDEVRDVQDLRDAIQDLDPGTKVSLSVQRDHKPITVPVEVAEREDSELSDIRVTVPDLPDLNIRTPRTHNLWFGDDEGETSIKSDQYKKQMEELKKQMQELKEQLREVEKKLK